MADGLLAALGRGDVLVADGAMGTMLHRAGFSMDRPMCELNLSHPDLVRDLHLAYLRAGADLVQTNTFDAGSGRLARAGLTDRTVAVTIAGARLAREAVQAAGETALVAGSVGPPTGPAPGTPSGEQIAVQLAEQITALADWVDLLVLETFADIDSLRTAVGVARQHCDLPVLAQLTFAADGRTLRGEQPAEAAAALTELDVLGIGANCTVGPAVLQDVIAQLARATDLPLSVLPNAGTPRLQSGQLRYASNTDYFAEAAREFVLNGATVVGGCCGTMPAHVRAIAGALRGATPAAREPRPAGRPTIVLSAVPDPDPEPGWPLGHDLTVLAGLPVTARPLVALGERAAALVRAGADRVALLDPEPPATRVNPIAAAVLVQEAVPGGVLLPVETGDRSLATLQADLLGAHALGVRTVVCRTGRVRVAGDYPQQVPATDIDSVRLVHALTALNRGIDWRGVTMAERTRFVVGAGFRTAAADTRRELARAQDKIAAGVHFLLTDVVNDLDRAETMLAALRELGADVPVVVQVAPFESAATVVRRLREEAGVAQAALTGTVGDPVSRAVGLVTTLREHVAGVLVHAPEADDPRVADVLQALAQLRDTG